MFRPLKKKVPGRRKLFDEALKLHNKTASHMYSDSCCCIECSKIFDDLAFNDNEGLKKIIETLRRKVNR